MAKNAPILWEEVDKQVESADFTEVAEMDARCFIGADYEKMTPGSVIYGESTL